MKTFVSVAGGSIDFNEWRREVYNNPKTLIEIEYGPYIVTVIKEYLGFRNDKLYQTSIECSSDLPQYFKYLQTFAGKAAMENDYTRLVSAIENKESIRDLISSNDDKSIEIMFSPWHNKHLVNVVNSDVVYAYENRADAVAKFEELTS